MLPISFSFLHPAVGLLLPGIYASPRLMRRAVAPAPQGDRPAESLTKPAAYPERGIYAVPCCTRRGRDQKFLHEVVSMAARLTDRQKKKIIADYVQLGSYNAVSKINGVSATTVKNIVLKSADFVEKCEQKKDENTADILAYMDSQKGVVCEIIGKGLAALNNPEKLAEASPAQITTALGTLIDKFTANTEPRQEIHPLLRDMYESRKQ